MNRTSLVRLVGLFLPFALWIGGCAAETESPGTSEPTPATGAVAAADPTQANADADDDDDTTSQSDDLTAAVTYPKVKSIVNANCGGCHAPFKTLAGIKAAKTQMIGMLSSGTMPKNNPSFNTTAKGKKMLNWLKNGPDLK